MRRVTIVTVGFIGFLCLCAECESLNSFLLSKLVGFMLLMISYILHKLTNRENQSNTLPKLKQDENELI